MTVEEAKRRFMSAYEWMLKVQQALLFKKFSVEVDHQFTPANYKEDDVNGWTVKLTVRDDEADNIMRAEWTPWYGDEDFLPKKNFIEGYLLAKGINI